MTSWFLPQMDSEHASCLRVCSVENHRGLVVLGCNDRRVGGVPHRVGEVLSS